MSGEHTLNIGFGNRVVASRIVAILVPGSSPMRRLKEETKKTAMLVNAGHGRKCRSILLLDSGHMILSAVHADTVCLRLETVDCGGDEGGDRAVASRIVAVLSPGSSSIARLREDARGANRLVDVTRGRKCRGLLVLDSGHVLLSVVHPDTLCKRLPALTGGIDRLEKAL